MASGEEAPEKTRKRAEGHSQPHGDEHPKHPPTPWENSIGRRDCDKTKYRLISERLRRQHWCTERRPDKLGTGLPRAPGPAKGLIVLLAKKPNLVVELYPAAQARTRRAPRHPDPGTMTAEERLAEVGQILAAGILRIRNPQAND